MLEPFKASYVAAALFGAALTLGQASGAELATDARAAAIHFGHVIGSAGTCIFIPVPRVVTANAKIRDLLGRFAAGHPEAPDLRGAFDQGMAEGKSLVPLKKTNCAFVENDLADLEHMTTLMVPYAPAAPKP